MEALLIYQEDVSRLLAELRTYRARHPDTVLLSMASHAFPGLPLIAEEAERVYRHYRQYLQTPWGLATYADIRYTTYPTLSYVGLHTLAEPAEGQSLPELHLPDPAVALVNPLTGMTAVFPGDGTAVDFRAVPAWEGKVTLPERWRGSDVLQSVRTALAQAGVPLYPGTLFAERVAYPWLTPEGLPAPSPFIANDEVRLPVIGYAVDPDTEELIYLNFVGHKTAVRSIWGSLNTVHHRKLLLETRRVGGSVISSHAYATYTAVVDTDTGLLRMQIVDRRALAADVEGRAYLVTPTGVDDQALDAAFAARLTAVLPVGIPAAWGGKLRQAGDELGLVRACLTGGDVGAAYTLTADEEWLTLIAGLLNRDSDFVIPKTLT
jgi:hypothetical protein